MSVFLALPFLISCPVPVFTPSPDCPEDPKEGVNMNLSEVLRGLKKG